MIDVSHEQYFSPMTVRRAFAHHGVPLRSGQGLAGFAHDERFGNMLVTYGGHDTGLLRRVQAAVSSIRNDS